jgi:limonene-1,2-epoxide hydrolase
MTPQERADVQVVRDWFAAWSSKDPEKVASYMGGEVVFRPVPDQPMGHGRAEFVKRERRLLQAGPTAQIIQVFAVGGPIGTAVLIKRRDRLTMNGKALVLGPVAAFFRVEHGKIQEWLDIPLEAMRGMGPPPGSGAPGVAAPAPK